MKEIKERNKKNKMLVRAALVDKVLVRVRVRACVSARACVCVRVCVWMCVCKCYARKHTTREHSNTFNVNFSVGFADQWQSCQQSVGARELAGRCLGDAGRSRP